ncbi:S1 RNA-binding domain-containing protein [Romboutsia hominis]|uniref:S1 RNA-binding domain-containing protein n=1 Tax=Romboutsia faecis TaxID=2764597 RepID=A0ABR7JKH2_9FIRM|nr:S1 RNA-binding domain-containing protein [Romboutsia faecis]MBC5995427.1 S1 RNA-binding domain-containing protein [Romboutsia faecis]
MFENIKSARVKEIIYNDKNDIDYIVLNNEKNKLEYKIEKYKIPYIIQYDLFIGKSINYVELKEGEISLKEVSDIKRKIVIEKLKSNEINKAKITKIINRGAYLSIYGVNGLITNCDFSCDYSSISDVYKEGDIIYGIEFRKISMDGRICVKKKEKYESKYPINYKDLKKGNLVVGIVKEVVNGSCFVGVINGMDMLCNARYIGENEAEGSKVVCKIKKVDLEKGILRGAIVDLV